MPRLEIKFISLLSNLVSKEKKTSFIIEYKSAVEVNRAVEENLVMSTELYYYTLYNLVYK